MTIWLPLFWRTWSRARASTRPHVQAWHMGRHYSNCRASELTDRQVSGFIFSWFLENTEKMKASSKAHAQGCRLPLFCSTWSLALGPDSATSCAGLAHGRDYSDCRASEEISKKCLAHELSKILENKSQLPGFFTKSTLIPQTAVGWLAE